MVYLDIVFLSTPSSSKRSLSFRSPQQNPVCTSSMRAAHPVHLILLDLITQITCCKMYTSRSSSLCNFLQVLDIYSLTDTNISLRILCPFLNTFAASYLNAQGLNNSCLKSPASTIHDLTFQSRALRSFSLNQLRNLSL